MCLVHCMGSGNAWLLSHATKVLWPLEHSVEISVSSFLWQITSLFSQWLDLWIGSFSNRGYQYNIYHCKKGLNITLVADRLRRQWLWEVYVGCISNLSNRTLQLTTRTCTIVRKSTTRLQKLATLTDVQCLLYLQDHMVVVACFLIQAHVTPSPCSCY